MQEFDSSWILLLCFTCLVPCMLSCPSCLMSYVLLCFTRFLPCVLSCLTCLMPYVLSCFTCLMLYVLSSLTCLMFYMLSCREARYVSISCSTCSHASCFSRSRASLASCFMCLVLYVLSHLPFSRALRVPHASCLASFMCQYHLFSSCFLYFTCFLSFTWLFLIYLQLVGFLWNLWQFK